LKGVINANYTGKGEDERIDTVNEDGHSSHWLIDKQGKRLCYSIFLSLIKQVDLLPLPLADKRREAASATVSFPLPYQRKRVRIDCALRQSSFFTHPFPLSMQTINLHYSYIFRNLNFDYFGHNYKCWGLIRFSLI
jgi:hypothetical protein